MSILQREYVAEPTAALFHASDARFRGLMGPVGSGKSVACAIEVLRRIMEQRPWNGVRKSQWAVIRNTYPQLRSTTIKTMTDWYPPEVFRVVQSAPIRGELKIPRLPDGTSVDATIYFMALDTDNVVGNLLSLELTGAWINEAKLVPWEIYNVLTGRIARYPSKAFGGFNWTGIIMDTNPPESDNWYYNLAEKNPADKDYEEYQRLYKFFRQPPALLRKGGKWVGNPKAENIGNHVEGYGYYLNQVMCKSDAWINVYILGNYGVVDDRRMVYPEYNDAIHYSNTPLEPIHGLPLIVGMDFALSPCAAICQYTLDGQFRVLDEVIASDVGVRRFISSILKPHLRAHYPDFDVEVYGDPAGVIRDQNVESTCFRELDLAGIPAQPASTNDFSTRREAVSGFLSKLIQGGKPGFLLGPKVKFARQGFLSGYIIRRVTTNKSGVYKDEAVKNDHSHIQDAIQYACLGAMDGVSDIRRGRISQYDDSDHVVISPVLGF